LTFFRKEKYYETKKKVKCIIQFYLDGGFGICNYNDSIRSYWQ